ncbi:MAG: hypothetical protein U0263_13075 [Polyangiaceae bacterium]
MDPQRLLAELVSVAEGLGITVRIEPLRIAVHHASGGLVRLNGQSVVLLDSKSPLFDRVLTLADALVPFSDQGLPEGIAPEVRELLDAARARRSGQGKKESRERQIRVLARPKPGLRRARIR